MPTSPTARIPSAPGAVPLIGHAWPLLRDPLAFLTSLPAHGDLLEIRVAGTRYVIACTPELTWQILTDDRTFDRGGPLFEIARQIAGTSIVTVGHDQHRRLRRLLLPAFHPRRISGYADLMADHIDALTSQWRDGQLLDVQREMTTLTSTIIAEAMFSGDISASVRQRASRHVTDMLDSFWRQFLLPRWIAGDRCQQAGHRLRQIVAPLITARRAAARLVAHEPAMDQPSNGPPHAPAAVEHRDLLAALLHHQSLGEQPLTDKEIEDQLIGFFIAGADTTSSTLAWAIHHLTQNPALQHELHREVDTVLAGTTARPHHLPQLTLTGQIITEVLRRYPPGWLLTRGTTRDTQLGDYLVPAGTTILYSPYLIHLTHRSDQPHSCPALAFDPHRSPNPHKAFIPFGAGARKCIGDHYAVTEVTLALATITARWHLSGAPTGTRPRLGAALRPPPHTITLHRRQPHHHP